MFEVIIQITLLVAVLCASLLYFYLRHVYTYWKKRGIPYEEPTMLFGSLWGLMRTCSIWDIMLNLTKKHKTDYVGIYLGWKPALVIHSKELAKNVLVKDFDNFQNRYTYSGDNEDPIGALNLFTLKNPIWSAMKQELTPMFTSLRLKGLTELMNINSAELVQRIQRDYIDGNKPVNLRELFYMYTSDIIGYTVFGLKVSVLKDLMSPLWYITRHMVRWTFWRGFEFTMIFFMPGIARLLRLKLFSAPATTYVKEIFWKVAKERKRNTEITKNDKDLLAHLLKIKENFKLHVDVTTEITDNLMIAQVALFIIGAIETSSSTLCFCLHELAHHPQKQEKLYQEIQNALIKKNKTVLDFYDLLELGYLTGCIKETLRKYASIAFLDRVCMKKYRLTDEVTIEEGTPVYVNVNALHYNEEYYPEPEKWRPERFESSTDNDNHDFTFLPFGEGPRFCIGKRYGMMQVRIAIAHMIMKYKFEPDEAYLLEKDPYSVGLGPKSGGKIKFVPRLNPETK